MAPSGEGQKTRYRSEPPQLRIIAIPVPPRAVEIALRILASYLHRHAPEPADVAELRALVPEHSGLADDDMAVEVVQGFVKVLERRHLSGASRKPAESEREALRRRISTGQ